MCINRYSTFSDHWLKNVFKLSEVTSVFFILFVNFNISCCEFRQERVIYRCLQSGALLFSALLTVSKYDCYLSLTCINCGSIKPSGWGRFGVLQKGRTIPWLWRCLRMSKMESSSRRKPSSSLLLSWARRFQRSISDCWSASNMCNDPTITWQARRGSFLMLARVYTLFSVFISVV